MKSAAPIRQLPRMNHFECSLLRFAQRFLFRAGVLSSCYPWFPASSVEYRAEVTLNFTSALEWLQTL